MLQKIAHICGRHATDPVGDRVKLLFLLAEMLIDRTLNAAFAEHADVDGVLRKDILQQKVGTGIVALFDKLDRVAEGNRWGGIQYQIKFDVAKMLLDRLFIDRLNAESRNTLFDDIGLLDIADFQLQNLAVGFFSFALLNRRDDIHLVTMVAKSTKQIGIDVVFLDRRKFNQR